MLLSDLVETSRVVAATRSRTAKTEAIAAVLRRATPAESATVAAYLSGVLPQRRIGVGWRGLSTLPEPAATPTLEVAEVDAALDSLGAMAGTGSAAARTAAVGALFGQLTADEQDFLRGLITGAMRQGALDGVMLQAISKAAAVPEAAVRRAAMLAGLSGPVAQAALAGGEEALARIGLEVGRPLRPMLAASAPDVDAALAQVGDDVFV